MLVSEETTLKTLRCTQGSRWSEARLRTLKTVKASRHIVARGRSTTRRHRSSHRHKLPLRRQRLASLAMLGSTSSRIRGIWNIKTLFIRCQNFSEIRN